jgi:hypothetical protein
MIATGLLNLRRYCAIRLDGKSPVGIKPICSLLKGALCLVVPSFNDCLRLLVLAGMHPVHLFGSLLESFV